MFGPVVAVSVFLSKIHSSRAGLVLLLAFPVGFSLGWLTWSVLVPRWGLWAYQRVDDIEELKIYAAAANVIWPEGHFFERTEIASAEVREKLRALEALKKK